MRMTKWMAVGLFVIAGAARAQDFGDTPYVQTPQNVVDRMLQIAKVGPGDYVIDLGSGDGRLIITAAKKFGARGFGVDLDRRLVELANKRAKEEGVSERASFYERDLYETDMTEATVLTIYLLPEVNLMVRPQLLATLKPGTRVVAHDYDMGEWKPDQQLVMDAPDKPVGRDKKSKVFFWVIPTNAAGKWRWEAAVPGKQATFDLDIVQKFQDISGTVSFNGTSAPIENARLTGEEISFTVAGARDKSRYEFSGRLTGGRIVGEMRVIAANAQRQLEWTAQRTELRQPAHALLKRPTIQELQLVQ